MRAMILVPGLALALAACGNNGQTENTTNVGENLTAEDIVSNDVTAIDAVTGDAANMAADMDVNFINGLDNELGNTGASPEPGAKGPTTRKPAGESPSTNKTDANETAPEAANAVAE